MQNGDNELILEKEMENNKRGISSQLGNVNINSNQRRELIVDEEELYQNSPNPYARKDVSNQIPDHLRNNPNIRISESESRQEDVRGFRNSVANTSKKENDRTSVHAINRLEVLVGIGRMVEEALIDDQVFKIRSLKSKELKEVFKFIATAETNLDQAIMLRNATLARALFEISGVEISNFVNSDSLEDIVNFIDEFDNNVLTKLWEVYRNMEKAHKERLGLDLGETPKEVSENLKK